MDIKSELSSDINYIIQGNVSKGVEDLESLIENQPVEFSNQEEVKGRGK